MAWERTNNVTDVVNIGDILDIKYFGVDPKTRKEKVSRKALLQRPPRPEGKPKGDRKPQHNKKEN